MRGCKRPASSTTTREAASVAASSKRWGDAKPRAAAPLRFLGVRSLPIDRNGCVAYWVVPSQSRPPACRSHENRSDRTVRFALRARPALAPRPGGCGGLRKPGARHLGALAEQAVLEFDRMRGRVRLPRTLVIEVASGPVRRRVVADGEPDLRHRGEVHVIGCSGAAHLGRYPSWFERIRAPTGPVT